LAPGGTPLLRAIGAKKLLQLIIRAGEMGEALAVQQAWPVTTTDRQNVPDRGREGPRLGLRLSHRSQEPLPPLHGGLRELLLIVEEVGDVLPPAIGHLHIGPQPRGGVQPTLQEGLQAPSLLG
jgi:hypothetical protein